MGEKMRKIEEEKEITQKEWDKIWKMFVRKKRKERKRKRQKQGKIANKIAIYKKRRIYKGRKIGYTWNTIRKKKVKPKEQEKPLSWRQEEILDENKSIIVYEQDYKIKEKIEDRKIKRNPRFQEEDDCNYYLNYTKLPYNIVYNKTDHLNTLKDIIQNYTRHYDNNNDYGQDINNSVTYRQTNKLTHKQLKILTYMYNIITSKFLIN